MEVNVPVRCLDDGWGVSTQKYDLAMGVDYGNTIRAGVLNSNSAYNFSNRMNAAL